MDSIVIAVMIALIMVMCWYLALEHADAACRELDEREREERIERKRRVMFFRDTRITKRKKSKV